MLQTNKLSNLLVMLHLKKSTTFPYVEDNLNSSAQRKIKGNIKDCIYILYWGKPGSYV